MKVVALVSGGKDSCFNMVKCVQYGHEIICIANLAPKNREIQEMDSWTFQTVGHNVVSAIADCMDVPFIQGDLQGKATQTTLIYDASLASTSTSASSTTTASEAADQDEVEDLFNLLQKVKQQFPQVEAVSSGAIFSDYQRNRIENVCNRLGLISLAYLWRKDQSELLSEMIQEGVTAILLKVATLGMNPRKHCGKTLQQMQPYLEKLKAEYGMNVCGEGGEYETLTLDCPLFKKRIVIDESKVEVESDDAFAPVGHLIITKYHLEDKLDIETLSENASVTTASTTATSSTPVWIPGQTTQAVLTKEEEEQFSNVIAECCEISSSFHESRSTFYVNARWNEKIGQYPVQCGSIFDQTRLLFQAIQKYLDTLPVSGNRTQIKRDSLQNVIVLKDMKDFGEMNRAYSLFFGLEPPSRVAVSYNSLQNGLLQIESAFQNPAMVTASNKKKVLHVQTISEWAPACIGPYSQATLWDGVVRLAGQIPFVPATMSLLPVPSPIAGASVFQQVLEKHASQCLENIVNTLPAIHSQFGTIFKLIIYYDITHAFWKSYHQEAPGLDVNQILLQHYAQFARKKGGNFNPEKHACYLVPCSQLPRSAIVEYQVFALSNEATPAQETDALLDIARAGLRTLDITHIRAESH